MAFLQLNFTHTSVYTRASSAKNAIRQHTVPVCSEHFALWQKCVTSSKDTIYTKLALMPWIDDNLGHTLSGLTQIGNIIAKIF